MNRWVVYGIATLLVLAFGFSAGRQCSKPPTKIEHQADSLLATVPAWKDTVKAHEALIAKLKKERDQARQDRLWQRHRADSLEELADQLGHQADSTGEIPAGITPSDSIQRLTVALTVQKRATVALRILVDTLKVSRSQDSLDLNRADDIIERQRQDLAASQTRIDVLGNNLAALREETKHKGQINVLGLHLPRWIETVAVMGGTAVVFYQLGKSSN